MTLVTATIRDAAGNTYGNALVEASYLSNIPAGTGTGPPLVSGSVFQTFAVSETDSFGVLSMNLTDLALITPTGGSWFFNVLNNTKLIGFSLNSFAVTGVSVDLTAAMAAASVPLNPVTGFGSITVTGLTDTGNLALTGATSALTAPKFNKSFYVDGVVNTTIQAAINAAKAAGGGEVVIPAGTYTITVPIVMASGVAIRGVGAKETIINTSGTVGFDIFTNAPQITNIALTSNVVTVTVPNNFLAGDQIIFGLVNTNTFLNGQTVTVSTASATQFTAPFTHANVGSGADTGVAALVATNIIIRDLYVNCTSITSGISRTVYFRNVAKPRIDSCEFFNSETFGIFMDDGCSNIFIEKNVIDTVQVGTCILIGNGPLNAACTDITIANNYCANTVAANGIFVIGSKVAATPGTARITITGNRLFHCADTGIEVGDSCTDVAVTGNVVQVSLAGETGILVRSCQNVTVAGNVVRADTAAANQIGIYIWNNAGDNIPFKNITICGNTVQGLSGGGSSGIAWSSSAATSDGLSVIANTSINNTTNYDPRTTNITNLTRYANSDGIFDVTKQMVLQKNGSPAMWFRDTSQGITTGGLWRIINSGTNWQIDMNTAAGGDFSAFFTAIQIDSSGNIILAQNKLVMAGLAGFEVRNGLLGKWFSDGGATLKYQIDGSTGKVTNAGGVTTVGTGSPFEYATVDLTAQTAAIGTTTLYAVPAAGAGQYRVSFNAKVTTAATTSSQLGALTVTWTDPDGVAITSTIPVINNSGSVASTDVTNTTAAHINGFPLMLNVKASTTIQYAMAYASVGATAMQYNLHIKLEFKG